MTNEQLAEFIQQGGNDELIPILWEKVKKLVYMLSDKLYMAYSDHFIKHGVEQWDVRQVSYNAFLKAIQGYKSEQGYKFTSYLKYPIKNAVNRELLNGKDPLNSCTSLDAPLKQSDGSEDTITMIDIIPDNKSNDFLERIDADSMAGTLWEIVRELKERQRDVIIARYKENKMLKEVAEIMGVSAERVRQIEYAALKELRKKETVRQLASEYHSHKRWISLSRFEYSPEYFDIIERLRERENKGEYISYGMQQAIIYDHKIKYEQQETTPIK